MISYTGREQLVDREAAGRGVAGGGAAAGRHPARRRRAAAARHHQPRAQLARRGRARVAAVAGNTPRTGQSDQNTLVRGP